MNGTRDKINVKNLEEASEYLSSIMKSIHNFGLMYETLTTQEKSALGGIVFAIVNVWNDSEVMGALVERPLGAMMINRLVESFNRRMSFPTETPQIDLSLRDKKKKLID